MIEKPNYISGGSHTDHRGIVSFVNDFHLGEISRFYAIEHHDVSVVRAWQGHQKEQKWFYVVNGSFKMVVVRPDDWVNPSTNLEINEFILSGKVSGVLHVPGGYVNGFKALEENSKMIVFSNFTTKQSSDDDYRFVQDLWYDWDKK